MRARGVGGAWTGAFPRHASATACAGRGDGRRKFVSRVVSGTASPPLRSLCDLPLLAAPIPLRPHRAPGLLDPSAAPAVPRPPSLSVSCLFSLSPFLCPPTTARRALAPAAGLPSFPPAGVRPRRLELLASGPEGSTSASKRRSRSRSPRPITPAARARVASCAGSRTPLPCLLFPTAPARRPGARCSAGERRAACAIAAAAAEAPIRASACMDRA